MSRGVVSDPDLAHLALDPSWNSSCACMRGFRLCVIRLQGFISADMQRKCIFYQAGFLHISSFPRFETPSPPLFHQFLCVRRGPSRGALSYGVLLLYPQRTTLHHHPRRNMAPGHPPQQRLLWHPNHTLRLDVPRCPPKTSPQPQSPADRSLGICCCLVCGNNSSTGAPH
jgi:hypothetical protein